MAASVLYTNFGGMLCHEDRGGVQRTYVHDEMGNTSFLVDATSVTDTYTYTPYGQVTHAGSNVTPFTFIGALGYFATGWSMLTSYVRARWYSNVSGSWGSVDPIWPFEQTYQYVDGNPSNRFDPSGLSPQLVAFVIGCAASGGVTAIGAGINFVFNQQYDPAWLCKSILSCLTGGLTALFGTLFGPAGGCFAAAVLGFLGKVGSKLCDCLAGNCCDDPLSMSPCEMFYGILNAIASCINAIAFAGYNKTYGTPQGKPNVNIFKWTVSNNVGRAISAFARAITNAILGSTCNE